MVKAFSFIWLLCIAPHGEIWTDTDAGRAKEAAYALERIREILIRSIPSTPPARPLRLFLLCSEAEFAAFRPPDQPLAAGFYVHGTDRDYIVIPNSGAALDSVVFHEYVHLFLHNNDIRVPRWFDEGMSELFSNARSQAGPITVGAPIRRHAATLNRLVRMDLNVLFTPAVRGLQSESGRLEIYYAESWALVRLLMLDPTYRTGLSLLLSLISSGAPHEKAFREAYGKSLDAVAQDARASLDERRLPLWTVKTEELPKPEIAQPTEPSEESSGLAIADLLLNLGRTEEAARRLAGLSAQTPGNAGIESELGDLKLRQGKPEEAFAHYSAAIQAGTTNPRIYFQRAMLKRDDPAFREQVIRDLRKGIQLDPKFTEARQALALVEQRSEAPVIHPPSKGWENPKGDRKTEGQLVEVDCLGTRARLIVSTASGPIALNVSDPSKVVLTNAAGQSTELPCGKIPPRPVSIEYLEGTREVTAILFR